MTTKRHTTRYSYHEETQNLTRNKYNVIQNDYKETKYDHTRYNFHNLAKRNI